MTKNSVLTLEIINVNAKGFGVGRVNDFVLLVDGALQGERHTVRVVKVKTRYGYAKTERILTPSPDRIVPLCPISRTPAGASLCGGCQFQHCTYPAQLLIKKQIVTDALERIGGLEAPPVQDVLPAAEPLRYRNKGVFPVVPRPDSPTPSGKISGAASEISPDPFVIGMYAARSHRVVEMEDCLLQHPIHVRVLDVVKDFMRCHRITPYNETTHTGIMRQVMVRVSRATHEVMVVLVINARTLPGESALAQALAAQAQASTVIIAPHTTRSNAVLGTDFRTVAGNGYIEEALGEAASNTQVRYRISPPSFFQVNSVQAKALYDTALEMIFDTAPREFALIDAHTGAGGVALYAARRAAAAGINVQIIGIDTYAAAITDAQKNAEHNGITNTQFITGKAEEVLPALLFGNQTLAAPHIIILDPPRRGCEPQLLDTIIAARIPRVVYISCDPATLARDIKRLREGGYALDRVQPVDMFPMTGHVECCALLQRADM